MRNQRGSQFHISGLAVLLVLAVFAISILSVLLTGANVYGSLTEESASHHGWRTAEHYLATRLRQSGRVYGEDFGGVQALVIPEDIDGETYITRIYCYEGWLRELFTAETGEFSPADGEKLLEMEAFSVIIEDNLVTLTVTLPGGETGRVLGSIKEAAHEE